MNGKPKYEIEKEYVSLRRTQKGRGILKKSGGILCEGD